MMNGWKVADQNPFILLSLLLSIFGSINEVNKLLPTKIRSSQSRLISYNLTSQDGQSWSDGDSLASGIYGPLLKCDTGKHDV